MQMLVSIDAHSHTQHSLMVGTYIHTYTHTLKHRHTLTVGTYIHTYIHTHTHRHTLTVGTDANALLNSCSA
jgi:hypothetical protein